MNFITRFSSLQASAKLIWSPGWGWHASPMQTDCQSTRGGTGQSCRNRRWGNVQNLAKLLPKVLYFVPWGSFSNQRCFWKTQTLLARQLNSGEIDTEGSLTDMVGGYTALEGRWSRGRQVKHQHSPSQHFPINFLFQGLYGGQFLFAGHGMEVEDSEKHKWKWQISSWGLKGSCQKIVFRTLS